MSKIKIPAVLIVHLLFIIIVYILQTMVFSYLPIGGIYPVLLPIAVVGIATFEGSSQGGGYGLFAGMLCDVSYNQPVLVMTVTLTLIGILVGILSETVMARGFSTYFFCCFGALLLTSFVSMLSLMFFTEVHFAALLGVGLWQTLISMIFSFPLYFAVRALGRRVLSPETSRGDR
jgi:rod shape-determining protein MreD